MCDKTCRSDKNSLPFNPNDCIGKTYEFAGKKFVGVEIKDKWIGCKDCALFDYSFVCDFLTSNNLCRKDNLKVVFAEDSGDDCPIGYLLGTDGCFYEKNNLGIFNVLSCEYVNYVPYFFTPIELEPMNEKDFNMIGNIVLHRPTKTKYLCIAENDKKIYIYDLEKERIVFFLKEAIQEDNSDWKQENGLPIGFKVKGLNTNYVKG